ncbi:MAG: xanthine dehydrogenase family protein subunit M [Phycisphaerae bacterium]
MYLPDVALHECETLSDAAALLSRLGPEARPLAGGTDLVVDLKTGRTRVSNLVSLRRIADLRGIALDDQGLRIGALTTIAELLRSQAVRERFAPLIDAARDMASTQVRNLATVGGNIASAVPCADLPPILMVLNASLSVWSTAGLREIPIDSFFRGPRATALRPGELIVVVRVPFIQRGSGGAYARLAMRDGNAIAVTSVAAGVRLENARISEARIALGAVAPTPLLVPSAAAFLAGKPPSDAEFRRAGAEASRCSSPISDVRGSAAYRREMICILTVRALAAATNRAQSAGGAR